MATNEDADLLTVAEAARLLKVSRITLHRWLKHGRLPAYHVGPKAVRIRRGDLATVMTPMHREEVRPMKETLHDTMPVGTTLTVSPPTSEEVQRTLAALAAARELGARIRERLGDQSFDESWPIIREAREERERSRQL